MANIYGPNEDNPGRDYNIIVLDLDKGKRGGLAKIKLTKIVSVKIIHEFSEKLDLVDVWRVLHPDTSGFTWRQHRQRIQCILVFFSVSQSTVILRRLTDIVPGYKKDRSMITLRLSLHSNPRGPGFWKLNISFLTELEYINQIETTIQETYDEHKKRCRNRSNPLSSGK